MVLSEYKASLPLAGGCEPSFIEFFSKKTSNCGNYCRETWNLEVRRTTRKKIFFDLQCDQWVCQSKERGKKGRDAENPSLLRKFNTEKTSVEKVDFHVCCVFGNTFNGKKSKERRLVSKKRLHDPKKERSLTWGLNDCNSNRRL